MYDLKKELFKNWIFVIVYVKMKSCKVFFKFWYCYYIIV